MSPPNSRRSTHLLYIPVRLDHGLTAQQTTSDQHEQANTPTHDLAGSGGYICCFPTPFSITPSIVDSFLPPSYLWDTTRTTLRGKICSVRVTSSLASAHRPSLPFDPWPCKRASRPGRGGRLGFQGGHQYPASVGAKCEVSAERVVVCAALCFGSNFTIVS